MSYKIATTDKLEALLPRYIIRVRRRGAKPEIYDKNGKGFFDKREAEAKVEKLKSLSKYKRLKSVKFEIVRTNEYSKNDCAYIITDDDGNIVDDNYHIGWRDEKSALCFLKRYEESDGYNRYEYLERLDDKLIRLEYKYMKKVGKSIYHSVKANIRANADKEKDELLKAVIDAEYRTMRLDSKDERLVKELFEILYNPLSFDFGLANASQRQAIETTEGPLLIIAGPGTGKTFTIVKRIIYLISEKGVKPEEILVSTFTKDAADELVTRITNELLDMNIDISFDIKDMYIGTIHSLCLRLLSENAELTDLSEKLDVLSEKEEAFYIGRHLATFMERVPHLDEHYGFSSGENEKKLKSPDRLTKDINELIENCFDTEAVLSDKSIRDDDIRKIMARAVGVYKDILKEGNNKATFTTIMSELFELICKKPEVLKKIQDKIKYFLIDEYQDTNYIQAQILCKLASRYNNICVVGDDDQGIYRFRGASVGNIVKFADNFGDGECKRIILERNYRSGKQIVDFYTEFMQKSEWKGCRFTKKLLPRDDAPTGTSVLKCVSASSENEPQRLVQVVKRLKDSGKIRDYNQIVFLFSSVSFAGNPRVKEIRDAFEKNNIPVYVPRAKQFFVCEEIKQFLGCFLRAFSSKVQYEQIEDENDRAFIFECIGCANELAKKNGELGKWFRYMDKGGIKKYYKKKTMLDVAYRLLGFDVFAKYLDATPEKGVLGEREIRNISSLINLIYRYNTLATDHQMALSEKNIQIRLLGFINYYLEKFIHSANEYEDRREYAPSGCVSFMTIHQSKGMEFPVVFVDVTDDVPEVARKRKAYNPFEKHMGFTESEPAELVRRFDYFRRYYTAFSRAQNLLILTTIESFKSPYDTLCEALVDVEDFDFSSIDYDELKKAEIKKRYSYTADISLYNHCPMRYKFFRVYGFHDTSERQVIVGKLVHDGIEHFNKLAMKGELLSDAGSSSIDHWVESSYNDLIKYRRADEDIEALELAKKQIKNYIENCPIKSDDIDAVEASISDIHDKYIFEGRIDLVCRDGDNKLTIIDYKSGEKPESGDDDAFADYKKQLEVYAYMLKKKRRKDIDKISLYYTSCEDSPMVNFNCDTESINNTLKEIDSVIEKIERNEFTQKCEDERICESCKFRYYCQRGE